MKTRRGWVQGRNAQAAVTPDRIILAAEVTGEANDVRQLGGMLDRAQANLEVVMGEGALLGAGGRCGLPVGGQRRQPDRGMRTVHRHPQGSPAARRTA